MSTITVYSKNFCPYCDWSKQLLQKKNVEYTEIKIDENRDGFKEMMDRTNNTARTVPQIFIGDTYVGGYDQLSALDKEGKLDPLLAEIGAV